MSAAVTTPTKGSQADFARAQGWQKSYVTALKQAGRLVFDDDGKVLFEPSLQRIKDTTGAPERAAPAVQGPAFSAAQDDERYYSARLKQIDYEKTIKKVRDVAEVNSGMDDAGAVFRAAVEAWVADLPPQIAALAGDEKRIAALLQAEGEQLLRRVSERFAALAAMEGAQ